MLSVFSGCAMITGGKGRTLPAGDQNRLLVKSWLTIVARSTSGYQAAGGSQVNWSCSAGSGADNTDGMPPISSDADLTLVSGICQ